MLQAIFMGPDGKRILKSVIPDIPPVGTEITVPNEKTADPDDSTVLGYVSRVSMDALENAIRVHLTTKNPNGGEIGKEDGEPAGGSAGQGRGAEARGRGGRAGGRGESRSR